MTRPRIWKDTTRKVLPWCATDLYNPAITHFCATWEDALEFVRDPLPFNLGDIDVAYAQGDVALTDRADMDMIFIAPRHWRPLARALTRLADKEGVK